MNTHPTPQTVVAVLASICEGACAVQRAGESLVASVLDEIVGTKQVRRGCKPKAESVVTMTAVIQKYIGMDRPIPFMCPWGSEKPDGSMIDVAEASAIGMIAGLNKRVKSIYPPGIVCNIRVEDVSAPHLFYDRADEARREAALYSDAFELLPRVMGVDCIAIKRESAMISEADFNRAADAIVPLMQAHLDDLNSADVFAALKKVGWRSPVSPEMKREYLDRYERIYPQKSDHERVHVLARYFSAVQVRYQLGLRGDDPVWGGEYLDLSFVEPSRATGAIFPRRVYYRTLPLSHCGDHVPPWRAKGFVELNSADDSMRFCLSCFRTAPELHKSIVTLAGAGSSVDVRCDWRLA